MGKRRFEQPSFKVLSSRRIFFRVFFYISLLSLGLAFVEIVKRRSSAVKTVSVGWWIIAVSDDL